jgi:exodeoxyribonuclease VIII
MLNLNQFFSGDLKPEIKIGLDEDHYHSLDYFISSSLVRSYLKSPAHFLYSFKNNQKDSQALLLGRAFHILALQPSEFQQKYVVAPDFGDLRKKENKDKKILFENQNVGRVVIAQEMFSCLSEMLESLKKINLSFDKLKIEDSFFFSHDKTSLKLKTRPDIYDLENKCLFDLKTTRCSSPQVFSKTILSYGYATQLAFYGMGLKKYYDVDFTTFKIIAVESLPPYNVTVFNISKNLIDKKQMQIEKALFDMSESIRSNCFIGYTNEEIIIDCEPENDLILSDEDFF